MHELSKATKWHTLKIKGMISLSKSSSWNLNHPCAVKEDQTPFFLNKKQADPAADFKNFLVASLPLF